MTKLILVRHGQTTWNKELKFQGHSDTSLSEEGLRQAELLADRLAGEKISSVYSSDLGRAFATAEPVAKRHGLLITRIPELREIHFGKWEGLTHKAINQGWPKEMSLLFTRPDEITIPGGESFSQLKDRAAAAIAGIVARHPEETVLVVSHGATIRTILCSILDIHLKHIWEIRQDNTAVNIIDYHEKRTIVSLVNDCHHLNA